MKKLFKNQFLKAATSVASSHSMLKLLVVAAMVMSSIKGWGGSTTVTLLDGHTNAGARVLIEIDDDPSLDNLNQNIPSLYQGFYIVKGTINNTGFSKINVNWEDHVNLYDAVFDGEITTEKRAFFWVILPKDEEMAAKYCGGSVFIGAQVVMSLSSSGVLSIWGSSDNFTLPDYEKSVLSDLVITDYDFVSGSKTPDTSVTTFLESIKVTGSTLELHAGSVSSEIAAAPSDVSKAVVHGAVSADEFNLIKNLTVTEIDLSDYTGSLDDVKLPSSVTVTKVTLPNSMGTYKNGTLTLDSSVSQADAAKIIKWFKEAGLNITTITGASGMSLADGVLTITDASNLDDVANALNGTATVTKAILPSSVTEIPASVKNISGLHYAYAINGSDDVVIYTNGYLSDALNDEAIKANDWNTSFNSITVSGRAGDGESANFIKFSYVDLAEVENLSVSNISVDGGCKTVVLPRGSSIPNEYGKLNGSNGTELIFAPSNDGKKLYVRCIQPDKLKDKASDKYVDAAEKIYVTEGDNTSTADRAAVESWGKWPGAPINLDIDADAEDEAAVIQAALDADETIAKITIRGTMDEAGINKVEASGATALDLSGVTNDVSTLKLPTSATAIALPGLSYTNGNTEGVVTVSTTDLDEMTKELKRLSDTGHNYTSITLPNGTTWVNGVLTVAYDDLANLKDIYDALTGLGLSINEIDLPGGSSFKGGALTVTSAEDGYFKLFSEQIRSLGQTITSAELKKDETKWLMVDGKGTVMTQSTDATTQEKQKKRYQEAGYDVSGGIGIIEVSETTTHSYEEFYQLYVDAGQLESKLKGLIGNTCTRLLITGTLNEADCSALESLLPSLGVETLCLDAITMSDYSKLSFKNNAIIKNIILPHGMSSCDPTIFETSNSNFDTQVVDGETVTHANAGMFQGCTSLNAAMAISWDDESQDKWGTADEITGSTVLAYVNKAGTLSELRNYSHRINKSMVVNTFKIAGNVNANDLDLDGYKSLGKYNNGLNQGPANVDMSRAIVVNSEDLKLPDNMRTKLVSLKLPEVMVHEGGDVLPDQCLYNAQMLTSLVIPDIYKEVGANCFHQCILLKSLDFGHKIQKIGNNAFENCKALKDVNFTELEGTLEFGDYIFQGCEALRHVELPEGTTKLGEGVFFDLEWIRTVRLPNTLQVIGDLCFAECENLEYIILPASVTDIGKKAFRLCKKLADVYLMHKSGDPLPNLWGRSGLNDDTDATFSGINVFHHSSTPSTLGSDKDAGVDFATGREYYNDGDGVTTLLHYVEVDKATDESRFAISISDDYYYTTTDGYTLPTSGNGSTDYQKRLEAGWADGSNAGYDANGWKQFILIKGTNDQEEKKEYLTKYYDDTWYTMCFPFNLTDDQLAAALGQRFEICEFTGAEIVQETIDGEEVNSLVLHFMDIAKEAEWLAHAGHPYMIHPKTLTAVGRYTECTFQIKKYETYQPLPYFRAKNGERFPDEDQHVVEYQKKVRDENGVAIGYTAATATVTHYVTHKATMGVMQETQDGRASEVKQVYQVGGEDAGSYTFVGKRFRELKKEDDYRLERIPKGAYFLGCVADNASDLGVTPTSDDYYPKFYREISDDPSAVGGKWSDYSAIIVPDNDAEKNIESMLQSDRTSIGSSSARAIDVQFGEYDYLDAGSTAVQDILQDAREKNLSVKYMNVVFNINGQIVRDSNELKNLPKGMYIVNGKKFFVK